MRLKRNLENNFLKLIILVFSVIMLSACHKDKEVNMDKATVIETVIYQTTPGVSGSEHIKKAAAISPILAKLPGFVSRQFSKTADGKWIDIIYWKNLTSAEKAAEEVKSIPECQVFFADMDEKTMQFMHSTIVSRYP